MAPAVISPSPVHPGRIRVLNPAPDHGPANPRAGPVVYWMFRDQRAADNWALLHAAHVARLSSVPIAVAFNLFPRFLGAHARQVGFMLRGLRRLSASLRHLNIPFFLLRGRASETIPDLLNSLDASVLVTDFSPLRPFQESKAEVISRVGPAVAVHEVDAHNVVPVSAASPKLEFSARTLRPKIHKLLPEYLVEFPEMPPQPVQWTGAAPPEINWDALIDEVTEEGSEVPEIAWCEPGEEAAMEALVGSQDGFLTRRLKSYDSDRNNPVRPKALSGLSPYLHFGQISAQRCALEAKAYRSSHPKVSYCYHPALLPPN